VDWECGGFANAKDFPSDACIGGGEGCGTIKAELGICRTPGIVARFMVAAIGERALLSFP
jgi:hypothetical protein